MTPHLLTLLTDFGTSDAYVGVLKGVVLGIAPSAHIVDLCHDVSPQDVEHAAFVLLTSFSYFPTETVHLAIVDPGVGTSRRLVAVRAAGYVFLGPDNGVLRWATDAAGPPYEAVTLANERYRLAHVSRTFHGRDILAPAAAHLLAGVPLSELGPAIDAATLHGRRLPAPRRIAGGLLGEVLHVDRFGNVITNVSADAVDAPESRIKVSVGGRLIGGISDTYQDGDELLAIIGSSGFVEIALRNGSAAAVLGLARGAPVEVTR